MHLVYASSLSHVDLTLYVTHIFAKEMIHMSGVQNAFSRREPTKASPAYIYAEVWAYFANRLRIKVTVNMVKPIQAVWHVIILQDS